jgi:hypothetical protein
MVGGRAASWFDDRTEKICALDEGRADRGLTARSIYSRYRSGSVWVVAAGFD